MRDLVLIQADEVKTQTESGLLIHEEWQTVPPTGVILAVGPQVKEVKVGDKVLFERYGATMPYGKEDNRRMCKAGHLLAKLTDD